MPFQISDNKEVHSARSKEPEYKVMKTLDGSTMSFHSDTPYDLCALIMLVHHTRLRVRLVYGNVVTGEEWRSATPDRGRIGRSTGSNKVPLLIRTKASTGGEALLDNCILYVYESNGGKLLYSRIKRSNG